MFSLRKQGPLKNCNPRLRKALSGSGTSEQLHVCRCDFIWQNLYTAIFKFLRKLTLVLLCRVLVTQ